jgi:RNA polymerase sigma factor (sigma-70 family)
MSESSFESEFCVVFDARFQELYRWLARYSGDASLASDVAQETFVRLYRRGEMPEDVRAWLVSVSLNQVRDEKRRQTRWRRLLLHRTADATMADPAPLPDEDVLAAERQALVRRALDAMSARERALLLLREEGYSYRELSIALVLNESSVGTLLARAKSSFREVYTALEQAERAGRNNATP